MNTIISRTKKEHFQVIRQITLEELETKFLSFRHFYSSSVMSDAKDYCDSNNINFCPNFYVKWNNNGCIEKTIQTCTVFDAFLPIYMRSKKEDLEIFLITMLDTHTRIENRIRVSINTD